MIDPYQVYEGAPSAPTLHPADRRLPSDGQMAELKWWRSLDMAVLVECTTAPSCGARSS